MILILGLLGMYFDSAVVFVETSSLLFRWVLTIPWVRMINFWNTIFEIHVIYAEIPFSKLSLFVIVLFTKWAEKEKQ